MKTSIQVAAAAITLIASPAVLAQGALQWRVEDGGNGHWYEIRLLPVGTPWHDAAATAAARGGHLATLTSSQESAFVIAMVGTSGPWFAPSAYPDVLQGPWLGGKRSSLSSPWEWVTGEQWAFTAFCFNQPSSNACHDPELCLHIKLGADCDAQNGWGDITESGRCLPEMDGLSAAIFEWAADCNSDGVVDYGQILQGQLADTNADGIPDVCQQPTCADADIYRDFNVNGADLGILLSQWGPNTPLTESDLNDDGVVNGADLGLLLSFWGACP